MLVAAPKQKLFSLGKKLLLDGWASPKDLRVPVDSWLRVCAPRELVSNLLEPVGASAGASLAEGSTVLPEGSSAQRAGSPPRSAAGIWGGPETPHGWTFLMGEYLGVRHLARRKDLCWFRLRALPSCRSHGRIQRGWQLRSISESNSSRARTKNLADPSAPAGLREKVWGRSWLPGLLSDFGSENQSSNFDEGLGKVLIHLLLVWWTKASPIICIQQLQWIGDCS